MGFLESARRGGSEKNIICHAFGEKEIDHFQCSQNFRPEFIISEKWFCQLSPLPEPHLPTPVLGGSLDPRPPKLENSTPPNRLVPLHRSYAPLNGTGSSRPQCGNVPVRITASRQEPAPCHAPLSDTRPRPTQNSGGTCGNRCVTRGPGPPDRVSGVRHQQRWPCPVPEPSPCPSDHVRSNAPLVIPLHTKRRGPVPPP